MFDDCFSFKAVATEGEQYLGMSMTYSLFEYVKENFDKLLEEQPEQIFDTKVSDGLAKLEIQEGEHYKYFVLLVICNSRQFMESLWSSMYNTQIITLILCTVWFNEVNMRLILLFVIQPPTLN